MSGVDLLADLLVRATWKGSLLVALVLLLTHVLRGRMPARWAHALLLVALVRLLLPFAPSSPLSLFNLAPRTEPHLLTALEPARSGALKRVPFNVKVPAPPPAAEPLPWRAAVIAIWAAGVLVAFIRIGAQSRAARRVVAEAEEYGLPAHPDPSLDARDDMNCLLDECREQMGIRRRVRLAVSASIPAPALYGVLRPTLLLPEGFSQTFSVEQLRFVFLHELAHLRRFDVLVNWIAAVVHALHWFNPLVRIAVSRLAEERELACDALALEHLGSSERGAYGGTLLRMLDQWRLPPPVPGLVGMTSAHHHVKRRIQMIATFRSESKRALWMALVLTIAVISLTDATAGTQKRVMLMKEPLSPEAQAVMEKLDQTVTLELTGASIDDVLHAVSNKTGISIAAAEGAIDDTARETKYDLKANNVPGHIVLLESLHALNLALRFDANGATVEKAGEGEDRIPAHIHLRSGGPDNEGRERIFIRERVGAGKPGEATTFERGVRRPIEVELDSHEMDRGVVRRKVTFRGSEGGQAEGTLELEVRRPAASTER
ncbi:MAG TPA: M56 family metallopeptidase [Thermoanaerobaculia bacterium]|nr:M56 family metallopeptidase [Thermoanaerobaculia bacterium]